MKKEGTPDYSFSLPVTVLCGMVLTNERVFAHVRSALVAKFGAEVTGIVSPRDLAQRLVDETGERPINRFLEAQAESLMPESETRFGQPTTPPSEA